MMPPPRFRFGLRFLFALMAVAAVLLLLFRPESPQDAVLNYMAGQPGFEVVEWGKISNSPSSKDFPNWDAWKFPEGMKLVRLKFRDNSSAGQVREWAFVLDKNNRVFLPLDESLEYGDSADGRPDPWSEPRPKQHDFLRFPMAGKRRTTAP